MMPEDLICVLHFVVVEGCVDSRPARKPKCCLVEVVVEKEKLGAFMRLCLSRRKFGAFRRLCCRWNCEKIRNIF